MVIFVAGFVVISVTGVFIVAVVVVAVVVVAGIDVVDGVVIFDVVGVDVVVTVLFNAFLVMIPSGLDAVFSLNGFETTRLPFRLEPTNNLVSVSLR